VPVLARHLEQGWQTLQAGVREKHAQPFAHEPVADVRVAVAIRSERSLCVVHMNCTEAVEADAIVDLRKRLVDSSRVGHVDA
jgi:hypothetical protein